MMRPLKKKIAVSAAEKPQAHACGQCSKSFDSEKGYLAHKCEKTGFTPTDPKHLGPDFEAISKAALARGESRKK